MSRYTSRRGALDDVIITDDDGDRLVVRQSDKKGHVVLAIAGKGQDTGAPCVEIKAEWLFKAVLEVNGS